MVPVDDPQEKVCVIVGDLWHTSGKRKSVLVLSCCWFLGPDGPLFSEEYFALLVLDARLKHIHTRTPLCVFLACNLSFA